MDNVISKSIVRITLSIFLRVLSFLIFFICYLLTSIQAQSLENSISLQEAWDIALEKNLTLRQVDKTLKQAEEEIKIERTNYYPTLNGSGSFYYVGNLDIPIDNQKIGIQNSGSFLGNPENVNFTVFNLTIHQPIFTGFRTRNLVKAAEAQRDASAANKAITKNLLLLQIGQLYYQIQSSLIQQQVVLRSIDRANNQLNKIRNLYMVNQAIEFDTLEVSNRKLQLQIELKNLENHNRIFLSKFGYLLKLDTPVSIQTLSTKKSSLKLHDLLTYQNQAIEKRPELGQLASLRSGAEYQGKALKSNLYPQLYASLGQYFLRPAGFIFKDEWTDFFLIGVNLKWDIWNWGRHSKKANQARFQYEKIELQLKEKKDEILQQIKETYLNLKNINEKILLQRKLVEQEKIRFQITEENFLQEQSTSLDLKDAEIGLTEAELILEKYYTDWRQSLLQMEYYTGKIGQQTFEGI